MNVPFVDLKLQYLSIKDDIDSMIFEVINNTAFIGGKYVREFEEKFKNTYGVKHCVGLANGTDAIYVSLKMMGIGTGDEVITVANSWISTSETISQAGATPVFVDIDPATYTIDYKQIEDKITSKTKAIIPVHLYGQAAHIDEIKKICDRHNLRLIEDCAQSHFSEENGQRVGTIGDVGTFSFYPGKNLGAYGDAGCVITNDDDLERKIRMYANHGALKKHHHDIEGINSRLDGLQAGILSVKLDHIINWTEKRIKNANLYNEYLANCKGISLPITRKNTKHSFHLYVIRCSENGVRDKLRDYLKRNGIDSAIHYPTALPNLPAYSYLGHQSSDFPIATEFQDSILSLPMYPELSIEEIKYVCKAISSFFK